MPQRARPVAGFGRAVPEVMSQSLRRAAVWTGAVAAATGAVLGAIVGVVCWLPDAGISGHPVSAVQAGVLGFLAAQHGGLTLDGVPTGLAPLLGLIVVVVIAGRAGAVLGEIADQHRVRGRRTLIEGGVLQAASYALGCLVLVPISALGTTSTPPVPVAVASFVLFGCVATTSLARARLALVLPAHVLAGARGAAGALAVYVAAGALLVAGSLVVHASTVMEMSRQVGGGLSGLPILVLGVLCAPNAAVAGAAYIAGPGFAVGSGTTFTAFSTGHGVLPAFPLLGALPTGHGANVPVLVWMVVSVLAAGLVAARLASGRFLSGADGVRAVAVAASVAGAGMALLAWLGGGAVGTGRLHTIGASPWQAGLAVAGEIATVALGYLAVQALRRRAARGPDVKASEPELATVGAPDTDR
ncbi:MAG TPA: DUF6350 family protein [Jatrophihabitantaceae bacterium]|jgi:hypothetical protein